MAGKNDETEFDDLTDEQWEELMEEFEDDHWDDDEGK
jgi:hypothetical protein